MRKLALLENLVVTVVSSIILIALGVIYLIATLWIVKFSSKLMGYSPDPNFVVVSAALIVAGIMVGSAIKNA